MVDKASRARRLRQSWKAAAWPVTWWPAPYDRSRRFRRVERGVQSPTGHAPATCGAGAGLVAEWQQQGDAECATPLQRAETPVALARILG